MDEITRAVIRCLGRYLERSPSDRETVSTVGLLALCKYPEVVDAASPRSGGWTVDSGLVRSILCRGEQSDICRLLRTVIRLRLRKDDFWELFQSATSAQTTDRDAWHALAAAVDYCRSAGVRFDLPIDLIHMLAASNNADYRIVALKSMEYCDALSASEVVCFLKAALESDVSDEQAGGLYELGVCLRSSDKTG